MREQQSINAITDEAPPDGPGAQIRAGLAVLRRRWLIILVTTVVVAAAAYALSARKADMFEADSTVLLNRQSVANQLSGVQDLGLQQQSFQQVLITQTKLAQTPTVLMSALRKAGLAPTESASDGLMSSSDVEADSNSDLIVFSVRRGNASEAVELSRAYADAYVQYRRDLDSGAIRSAVRDVDRAIASATDTGDARTRRSLEDRRQQLQERLALATGSAQVVARAAMAPKVAPSPLRSSLLGLLAGLVIGVSLALLREVLETKVRSEDEIGTALGLVTLGRLDRSAAPAAETLVTVDSPSSTAAESFRVLRATMNFGLVANGAKVILVTSANPSEGKSTTVANLAVATAASGKRVALVDLDLRLPKLHRFFGLAQNPGATTVILGESDLDGALKAVELAGAPAGSVLEVLTSGPLPPDASGFLGIAGIDRLVDDLREQFDYVFVDGPPSVGLSDALVTARVVDAVVVVARVGQTRKSSLRELRDVLAHIGRPVLGVVITGAATPKRSSYYQYYAAGADREAVS